MAVGALSAAGQHAAEARDRRRFPPPGRRVDIGGRKLHVLEADGGAGSPPTVIIPALADSVLAWAEILPQLAADGTLACVYDRADIGWSDPGPRGHDLDQICADLRALLTAAGIGAPVILVGHSLGGIMARRFTALYPQLVAGLLLIDSSHEAQGRRLRAENWSSGDAGALWRAVTWRLRPLGMYRLGAALGLARSLDASVDHDVPPDLAPACRAIYLAAHTRRAIVREFLLSARLHGAPSGLGALPLTVLSAGRQGPAWMQMQRELAALSSDSEHVVARDSGHYIHRDQPDVVVRAARDLAVRVSRPGRA